MVDASKPQDVESKPNARKLMHRLKEQEVEEIIDAVQKESQ
jgi:hypothetical protein